MILLYFAHQRKDLPFRHMFGLFGAFIVACGTTHLLGYLTFQTPVYRLDGLITLLTALVSWATVFALIPVTPKALAMRSPEELEREIAARTQELARANAELQAEIVERRRAEEQLLHAQKIESVGRLAGGVAHDFNNLLTAILGFTDLAAIRISSDTEASGHLRNVRHAAERAAALTQQLLAFARRQIIEPKIVDVNILLLNLDKLLRRVIREDIELVILPRAPLWEVRVDPAQLEQVLVNLVVNARDAMPNGGKITIEANNAVLDEEYARQYAEVVPGEYVAIAVSDTGVGMTEEVKQHVFEPFFTTKGQGEGTGLGLATCYGIVKQNGGHIWFYSEPGEGSTFKIYLPRARGGDVVALREEAHEMISGKETILLVEDEPLVRELAVRTLRKAGYEVLEAANGAEALRVAETHEGEIHLLMTDVVMPQMSGKALAEQLQAIRPEIRVLYSSGYTDNTIVHHGVLDAGAAFLQKPYTPAALARKVREVLDGENLTR